MIGFLVGMALATEVAPESTGPLSGGAVRGADSARVRFWHVPDTLPGSDGIHFEVCPSSWFSPDYCGGSPDHVLDYQEVVNRLNLTAGGPHWRLSLQGDAVALLSNRYQLDGEVLPERVLYNEGVYSPFEDALFVPEKITMQGQNQGGSLTVGDTYASFGRGLALNLVKNTDVDLDTSLRGIKGDLTSGDWDLTAFTALTNPQQVTLENPNEESRPDDGHAISGLKVVRYGLGPASLGAHGVLYQFQPEPVPGNGLVAYNQPVGAAVGGGSVDMSVGAIQFYLEGDGFSYNHPDIAVDNGYAVYGSASIYAGAASVLVEAKRYKNTEYVNQFTGAYGYEMAAGPSLEYERVITEDSSATVNSNDVWGGKAEANIGVPLPSGNFAPFLSVAVFRDNDTGGIHFNRSPETIVHPILGFLLVNGAYDAQLHAGVRADLRDPFEGADAGMDRTIHADGEVTIPVAGPVSLGVNLSVLQYHWGVNYPQQGDFLESANALSVRVGEPFTAVIYAEYSDNPLITTTGNFGDDLYGAAELQWKPSSATTIKGFYGAYRAGIHCAGGQCRYLPGFEGAKFSVDTTF